jgi:GT2 family glycosyltransferase
LATSTLDIIIVSYNAREDLAACLESLGAHPPSLPHTIVVVDNASSDGSAELVADRWPGIRLIRNPANVGFGRANNMGIRSTAGDLILLLNGDTIVGAGAIDDLVRALQETHDAAIAGPRLVDSAGTPELSFGRMISPLNELRQKLLTGLSRRGFGPAAAAVKRATCRRQWVDWVSGACLLVWRHDALAAGLLDERFFIYAEDVDFCAAVRKLGRRILFTPSVQIVHRRGRSRATAPHATTDAYRRSQLAFYRKHHPRWAPWLRAYLWMKGALPSSDSPERSSPDRAG